MFGWFWIKQNSFFHKLKINVFWSGYGRDMVFGVKHFQVWGKYWINGCTHNNTETWMCVGGCVQECDTVAQTSVSFTSGYVLLAPTGPAVPAVQNTESLHEQERTNTHTHRHRWTDMDISVQLGCRSLYLWWISFISSSVLEDRAPTDSMTTISCYK